MKCFSLCAICVSLAACGTNSQNDKGTAPGGQGTAPVIKAIEGVTNKVSGMREVANAKVNGKEVVAVLHWRDYDPARDASVTKWYGDMGRPPAKYVVKSLIVSIDGRGLIVPQSKTRYLASQWMNGTHYLGVVMMGKNPCVYVDLGDGGEAWTATYLIDASTATLISHEVMDGPDFHNQIMP